MSSWRGTWLNTGRTLSYLYLVSVVGLAGCKSTLNMSEKLFYFSVGHSIHMKRTATGNRL